MPLNPNIIEISDFIQNYVKGRQGLLEEEQIEMITELII